jgi:hypothetical protein
MLFETSYLRRAMMLTGLEILLARMKTNPEEFLKDNHVPYEGESFGGKWMDLIAYAWRIANEEERQALEDARREFYRDDFNERVMKRLAGEEVKEEVSPYIVKSTAQASQHWTDPRMAMQNAVLQGGTGFGQAQAKQEGAPVGGMGNGFWGGIVSSGKGKLW